MLEQLSALAAPSAELLLKRGETVAVVDGATGGLVSAALLTIGGATSFFRGGGVLYSMHGRKVLFDLPSDAFAGLQSVTEPYTLLQAGTIRERLRADWGIAESGSAGPGVHPRGVEAGTSCISVVGPGVSLTRIVRTGSSSRIPNMAEFAKAALQLFHEALLAAPAA